MLGAIVTLVLLWAGYILWPAASGFGEMTIIRKSDDSLTTTGANNGERSWWDYSWIRLV
jgi:hypothetical protein